jgi:transposase
MATKREAKKAGPRGSGHRYAAEFRREALRMMDGGKTMAAVSAELGVSIGTLTQWRLKASAGAARGVAPGPTGESVTAENDRLKRENKALRMELDFAKKAAAFFARHGVSNSR